MSKHKTSGVKSQVDNGKNEERKGRTVVRYRCNHAPSTIQDVLNQRQNWVEVNGDEPWDFSWTDVGWLREEIFDQVYLDKHVRVNHFRNHYELTRKNLMVKNLKHHQKSLQREARTQRIMCDFFPSTYSLPTEYHLFVEEFNKNPGSIWIMKPAARAQGRGIFLFRKLKDIIEWRKDINRHCEEQGESQVENYVAQLYIAKPYLINGRKFDLRVYVLVTSYDPLKAWLYRCGFARFSCSRFSLSSIDDKFVHLTNVAIQKTAPDYDPKKDSKWPIKQLRRYLTAKHGIAAVDTLFQKMDAIFIHSLLSVQKVMIHDKHCFELYGYDILLDQSLKPWLIEVNSSPSSSPSSQEDYELKCNLLDDTLNVVDMEGRLTGKEKRVGGYDLMWNDGPVFREDVSPESFSESCLTTNTNLGCTNDRKKLHQMPSRAKRYKMPKMQE